MIFSDSIAKSVKSLAGKLLAEGLNPETCTKEKAKEAIKNTVASVYCQKIIDAFFDDIVEEMETINKFVKGLKK